MGYPRYVSEAAERFEELVGVDFLEELVDEIGRARAKFPGNSHLTVALAEEVGELAKAQLQREPKTRIRSEAIQVITVAIRIVTEGDADLAHVSNAAAKK